MLGGGGGSQGFVVTAGYSLSEIISDVKVYDLRSLLKLYGGIDGTIDHIDQFSRCYIVLAFSVL